MSVPNTPAMTERVRPISSSSEPDVKRLKLNKPSACESTGVLTTVTDSLPNSCVAKNPRALNSVLMGSTTSCLIDIAFKDSAGVLHITKSCLRNMHQNLSGYYMSALMSSIFWNPQDDPPCPSLACFSGQLGREKWRNIGAEVVNYLNLTQPELLEDMKKVSTVFQEHQQFWPLYIKKK